MSNRRPASSPRFAGRLWRSARGLLAWWASLFLLVGSTSTCPCCGQQSCPGGWASAGLVGGLLAAIISFSGRIRKLFRRPKAHAAQVLPCHDCGGPSAASCDQPREQVQGAAAESVSVTAGRPPAVGGSSEV